MLTHNNAYYMIAHILSIFKLMKYMFDVMNEIV